MRALRAVTIDAARQHFEEDRKGSLEVGKLADLVILSESPIDHPDRIDEIEVLERMAKLGNIDADVLDELYDWVTEGWTWLARGRRILKLEIPGDELLLGEPDSD